MVQFTFQFTFQLKVLSNFFQIISILFHKCKICSCIFIFFYTKISLSNDLRIYKIEKQ